MTTEIPNALKLALEWYDSGKEDRQEFETLMRRLLAEQPAQQEQQEPHEWLTGCPDCGMDSCDCDEGTWNQPASKPWVGLTDEQQVAEALRRHGLTLVKNATGYDVLKLGQITAHGITGEKE